MDIRKTDSVVYIRLSDLVDAAGKTGDLAGRVVLVKNALCAGLVDRSLSCDKSCCCSCLVAGLYSLVDFLDSGLDGRLYSLVCSGLDLMFAILHTSM